MISDVCGPIRTGEGLAVPLLEQIDCQIAGYVELTYGTLFGPFGFLEPILTAALTIYLAFYGFQLITGRGSVSLSGIVPKMIVIGVVLTFATRWSAYQTLFFNLLFNGSDQLAGVMVGGQSALGTPSMSGTLARLDLVFEEIVRLASNWLNAGGGPSATDLGSLPPEAAENLRSGDNATPTTGPARLALSTSAVNLLWFSGITLALGTVGILVIAKILLGLLLAFGPVMVVMALFSATRGLFEGWLRTVVQYALVPLFVSVLTAGIVQVAEPIVLAIRRQQELGTGSTQPVFVLAMTIFIFALLVAQLFRLSRSMTGSWSLKFERLSRPDAATINDPAMVSREPGIAQGVNPRIADMVMAVERTVPSSRPIGPSASISPVYNNSVSSVTPTLSSRRTAQRYSGFGRQQGGNSSGWLGK